jgi:uncharacterized membrane protein
MESIDFQGNGFFNDLVKAVETCHKNCFGAKNYAEFIGTPEAEHLLSVVKKHTGITLFYTTRYEEYGPAIIPAQIKEGHVFTEDGMRDHPEIMNMISSTHGKNRSKVVSGSVNLKEAKVYGFFADQPNELLMPMASLTQLSLWGTEMTAEEIAAILMHEIGHAFTFFEFLTRTSRTNQVLAYLSQKRTTGNPEEIKSALAFVSKTVGMTKDQEKAIENAKSDEETAVLLMTIGGEKMRSELGVDFYDSTACEQLADQFACRMGCGHHVIFALEKLGGLEVYNAHKSKWGYLIEGFWYTCLISSLFLTSGFILALGVVHILLIGLEIGFAEHLKPIYDNGEYRPKRIMQDMIERLKDRTITQDEKVSLVENIERLKIIVATKDATPSILEYIKLLVNSSYKKAINYEVLQKQLETLASNSLYTQAAKLQLLADK